MLFGILLTVQIIICVSMGGLILVQQSEGGALGMGGGPSGFMSARGAGNLLTKATAILAFLFFANCIGLTIVGNMQNRATSAIDKVDTSKLKLNTSAAPAQGQAESSASKAPSLSDLPLAGGPAATPAVAPAATKPAAAPVLPLGTASSASSSTAKP